MIGDRSWKRVRRGGAKGEDILLLLSEPHHFQWQSESEASRETAINVNTAHDGLSIEPRQGVEILLISAIS